MNSLQTPATDGGLRKGSLAFLLLAVIFAYCYFLTPLPLDNVSSRLSLTASLALKKSVIIDEYHDLTIDKAFYRGHYYSDKAPGTSLFALPLAMVYKNFGPVGPKDILFRQAATIFTVSIPAALGILFLVLLIYQATGSGGISLACGALTAFGTLYFPYSTLFYGHVPAAAMSIILFYIALDARRLSPARLIAAGFLMPWMVITEYPLAIHASVIFVLMAVRIRKKINLAALLPGFAVVSAIYAWYNMAAFGGVFQLGYLHESWKPFAEAHTQGVVGVTYPRLSGMYQILVHPGHGLLALSPFLIFAVPGFAAAWKLEKWRTPALSAALISAAGILVNAAHFLPMGGATSGPRHLIPVIPYLAFLCAFSLVKAGPIKKSIFAGLATVSLAIHFIITCTDPQPSGLFDSAIMEDCLRLALEGFNRFTFSMALAGGQPASMLREQFQFGLLLRTYLLPIAIFVIAAAMPHIRIKAPGKNSSWTGVLAPAGFIVSIALMSALHFAALVHYSKHDRINKMTAMSSMYLQLHMDARAAAVLKEAVDASPNDPLANFNMGMYYSKRDTASAIIYFRRAAIVPTFSEAHYNLCALLYSSGDLGESRKHCMAYLATDRSGVIEKTFSAEITLARIEIARGNMKQAERWVNIAEKTRPGSPALAKLRGMLK